MYSKYSDIHIINNVSNECNIPNIDTGSQQQKLVMMIIAILRAVFFLLAEYILLVILSDDFIVKYIQI